MYYYIFGEVVLKGESFVVLEAAQVGYKIYTSAINIEAIKLGEKVKLLIYCYIREDAFDLYGFRFEEEKQLFEKLLGVSGIGPKAALSILSVAEYKQIALAIVSGNTALIKQASGIGDKVANRVVLELSKKLSNASILPSEFASTPVSASSHISEALEALAALGYNQTEAGNALSTIDCSMDLELIIKEALKKLMK